MEEMPNEILGRDHVETSVRILGRTFERNPGDNTRRITRKAFGSSSKGNF